jgi:hypothetical protein
MGIAYTQTPYFLSLSMGKTDNYTPQHKSIRSTYVSRLRISWLLKRGWKLSESTPFRQMRIFSAAKTRATTQEPINASDPASSYPSKVAHPELMQNSKLCAYQKQNVPVEAPAALISFPSACDITSVRSAARCKNSFHPQQQEVISPGSQVSALSSPRRILYACTKIQ